MRMLLELARHSMTQLAASLGDTFTPMRSLPSFQGLLSGQGLLLCHTASPTLL